VLVARKDRDVAIDVPIQHSTDALANDWTTRLTDGRAGRSTRGVGPS
jgi:hypothetical protein